MHTNVLNFFSVQILQEIATIQKTIHQKQFDVCVMFIS